MPKQAEAERDSVINPQNYNFNFYTENFDAPKALTNQPNLTVELRYICPRGLTGQPAVTLTK